MVVKIRIEVNEDDFDIIRDRISREIAEEIYERSQKNIEEMDIIASGYLKRSGFVGKLGTGVWIVKYYAPYSVYVDYGTEPHMPPVEPLINWAKNKLGLSDKEAKRVAWAIATEISKYGTKPRPFFRNAVDSVAADIKLGKFRMKRVRLGG